MTCIVGLIDKDVVHMGADSLAVAGYGATVRKDKKIFKKDNFIIGFTSSYRMGQLIRYKFQPPPYYTDNDLFGYMVTDFVDKLRKCLKEGGFTHIENSVESGGCFLIGFRGRLFKIEGDFQVEESALPFNSTGCGEEIALGALYTVQKDIEPKNKLLLALKAAQEFSAGVREPFHFISAQ